MRLLAQREHSRAELERKLVTRATLRSPVESAGSEFDPTADVEAADQAAEQLKSDVVRVLDELELHGLLSDTRTADALLLAKAPRYGSRRLKQLLQAKSLDADLISTTLARAHDSEFERARSVWQRRFRAPPADLRERARQQRFLAARGFASAIIERVLKEARWQVDGEESPASIDPEFD